MDNLSRTNWRSNKLKKPTSFSIGKRRVPAVLDHATLLKFFEFHGVKIEKATVYFCIVMAEGAPPSSCGNAPPENSMGKPGADPASMGSTDPCRRIGFRVPRSRKCVSSIASGKVRTQATGTPTASRREMASAQLNRVKLLNFEPEIVDIGFAIGRRGEPWLLHKSLAADDLEERFETRGGADRDYDVAVA